MHNSQSVNAISDTVCLYVFSIKMDETVETAILKPGHFHNAVRRTFKTELYARSDLTIWWFTDGITELKQFVMI